jgi:hypothetical protein
VCIPPGAQLVLKDIPARLQSGLGLGMEEDVVFVQTSMDAGRHRDAVRFHNCQQVLLQRLAEGQRAVVISMGGATHREQHPAGITRFAT